MKATERQFDLGGLKIAALEWPAPVSTGGLPIIALHGWLDNAASFAPIATYLAEHHLLALDLPGHGHSDHLPPYVHYHLADHLPHIAAIADEMGWERFVLLGHSMGAGIASLCAAAMPQRVMALTLIDGISPLIYPPQREVAMLRKLLAEGGSEKSARAFRNKETAARVRHKYSHFPISPEAASVLSERNLIEKADGFHWRYDSRLLKPSTHYYCEEQMLALLDAISAPVLLIKAAELEAERWAGLTRLTKQLPEMEIESLDGGHHLHMDQPQRVAERILRFYEGLEA